MPLRKSKAPAPASLTLKQRVTAFWKWFVENADRFYTTIENKKCADLQPETSAAVDQWLGGMAWVYGPGENRVGLSLTLSGEAVLPKQFVAEYWASQAPRLKGWTFYSSRQPSEDEGGGIVLHLKDDDEKFKPIEFWVFPFVDKDEEKIDISVWHPSIKRLPERTRFMALFLILDELLGEHGTQNWIGEIKFSEEHLKKAIPIAELPDLIKATEREHEWKKYPPTDAWGTYELREHSEEWLRGDTRGGTTRYFNLIRSYLKAEGPCNHPVPDVGVDFVFVAIPVSFFPKGKEVDARCDIADEIVRELESTAAGMELGGATGSRSAYMDFVLYDGDRSLEIIKTVLSKHRVPKQTRIHFFTSDRVNEVIKV